MEKYFIIVNGRQLEISGAGTERIQPRTFNSREDAESYVEENSIKNATVMSSTQWRDEIQHRIALRNKS